MRFYSTIRKAHERLLELDPDAELSLKLVPANHRIFELTNGREGIKPPTKPKRFDEAAASVTAPAAKPTPAVTKPAPAPKAANFSGIERAVGIHAAATAPAKPKEHPILRAGRAAFGAARIAELIERNGEAEAIEKLERQMRFESLNVPGHKFSEASMKIERKPLCGSSRFEAAERQQKIDAAFKH